MCLTPMIWFFYLGNSITSSTRLEINSMIVVLNHCDRSILHHLCIRYLFAIITMEVRSLGPSVQPPDFEIQTLIFPLWRKRKIYLPTHRYEKTYVVLIWQNPQKLCLKIGPWHCELNIYRRRTGMICSNNLAPLL